MKYRTVVKNMTFPGFLLSSDEIYSQGIKFKLTTEHILTMVFNSQYYHCNQKLYGLTCVS